MFYLGFVLIAILTFCSFLSDTTQNNAVPQIISSCSNESQNSYFLNPTNKFKPESPDFILVQDTSLKASIPPVMITPQVLGAILGGSDPNSEPKKEIIEYTVESGDTIAGLAERFNISVATITAANNLSKNSALKTGQKLIILPVSGIIHHVKSGDTIDTISQKYKAKNDDVVAFNELSSEGDIYIGDILVVPGGVMPVQAPIYVEASLASSYFIPPITLPYVITQGLHWHNAIDFNHGADSCGSLILAAAGGTVLKVKLTDSTSKWVFNGAGNNLTILHPNGVVTYYGHISTSFVNPGDVVYQGQIIALMGGQPGTPGAGNSTGCHVHFGVSGARNPFSK